MTSLARLPLNPYEPPSSIDADVENEFVQEIRVPTWGEVIINAAFSSAVPAVIVLASSVTNWGLLLILFIVWPLCFRHFLIRTYRLQPQDVPRFRWMPFLTLAILIFLSTIAAVLVHVFSSLATFFPNSLGRLSLQTLMPIAVGIVTGILCLTVDYVVSISITRNIRLLWAILPPLVMACAGSLATVVIRDSLVPMLDQFISTVPSLRLILLSGAVGLLFSAATFYTCLMTHLGVRERLLKALADPRQFSRGRFKL